MIRNNAIDGIDENGVDMTQGPPCKTCLRAKLTESPGRLSDTRERVGPEELLCIDTIGPLEPSPFLNYKYFLVCYDYHTCYRHVYFLVRKTAADVAGHLKHYISSIETHAKNQMGGQTGVKFVRSDSGTEMVNRYTAELFASRGITHQLTTPDHPRQNPAERQVRLLCNHARALILSGVHVPTHWEEAVEASAYLLNRTVNTINRFQSPHELLFHHKPSIKHIKPLGCLCYVRSAFHLQDQTIKVTIKFSERGHPGVLLNYDLNSTSRKVVRKVVRTVS